mmetsp:Transcript_7075/g.26030  ORF Transcript_7075/g.26030 Transcript_7075/m.26030 type:complete len:80 (-) Transcript_7075:2225-2464(-)
MIAEKRPEMEAMAMLVDFSLAKQARATSRDTETWVRRARLVCNADLGLHNVQRVAQVAAGRVWISVRKSWTGCPFTGGL